MIITYLYMSHTLKTTFSALLGLAILACNNETAPKEPPTAPAETAVPETTSVPDTLYIWNNKTFNIEAVGMATPTPPPAPPPPSDAPPVQLTWKTMEAIHLLKNYYPEAGTEMLAPVFSDTLQKLNGRMVEVEGYVVPVDESGAFVALSATPYASCFFCGKGSPASVMTVKLARNNKNFETDDYRHFRGRLRLNYSQIDEFYYVLEGSELLGTLPE